MVIVRGAVILQQVPIEALLMTVAIVLAAVIGNEAVMTADGPKLRLPVVVGVAV